MAVKITSHWPITFTNGVAALFNLVLPLVMVRILSPEEVGRYKIFFLYVMLSPGLFLVTGLNNGLYHWVGKYPQAKFEVRQSWTLMGTISLVLSVLGLFLSPMIAPYLKVSIHDLRLLFVCVPFIIASAFLEDLMIARGDIWTGSLYGSGFSVLRALSIVVAAGWTHSMVWVISVFVVCTMLRTLVGWFLLAESGEIKVMFSWQKSREVLQYAMPVSIAAVSSSAIYNVDQMILSFRLHPTEFALYALGCLSIPPLNIFEISVNRVLIPGLSRAFSNQDSTNAARLFKESIAELHRFLFPATLGLILYARPIIELLFTGRYSGAAVFLQFYALTYLFLAIPFDAIARARADGGWILRTYLFFSLACIGGAWWATVRWQAMGALIAVLSSQCLMRTYALMYARRQLGVEFSKFIPLNDLGIQTGLGLVAGACSLLSRPLFTDLRTWFLVTGPLFTLIYFSGIYAISLRRHRTSSDPIHVLELSQTIYLGGLERMIYCLSRELQQYPRFKVLVATYDHAENTPSLASELTQAGVPLIQWQKGEGFSIPSVFRLVHLIFSERTRILHVHNLGPLIYGTFAKWLSFGRVRLVLTLHSLTDFQQSRQYQMYMKLFLRFPDRIIAVSHAIQTRLTELGVPPQRIEVIPNGVLFSDVRPLIDKPQEKIALRQRLYPHVSQDIYEARWILCLGRLHPGKGQEVVLDVWSALPQEARLKSALFFVGQETYPGHKSRLRQLLKNVPDSERVIIAGPSELPGEWIQSADLFISGSLQEGMPLAPIEAAGSGLPIVLSDIEGHHFLQPWAHFFNPKQPGEGAARIVEILQTLEQDKVVFENRWQATASLREMWSAPSMTESYAETFMSA